MELCVRFWVYNIFDDMTQNYVNVMSFMLLRHL